ncbi:MAG: type II toxin-antitoxin system death-on-curing family toxin [Armatimonadetes bacterium]|nr:type II toxin-antitoxin system death-on-curing family toxin [Armatimonadota bacterium]
MKEPIWFTIEEVFAIHERQISRFGGSPGLRDQGMLESALARAQNLWSYGEPEPDIAALAAAYAFGVIKNYPFVDGNKRVGYVLARVFLLKNGWDTEASAEDKYLTFYAVAAGERSEEELAVWIRNHTQQVSE